MMKFRIATAWHTLAVLLLLGETAQASLGDRLPDFKDCVHVRVDGFSGTKGLVTDYIYIGVQRSQLRSRWHVNSYVYPIHPKQPLDA